VGWLFSKKCERCGAKIDDTQTLCIDCNGGSSALDMALKAAGAAAIVGGVAAAVLFGPAIVGGALFGVGVKTAAIGAGIAGASIFGSR
jgi:hypothetical protein